MGRRIFRVNTAPLPPGEHMAAVPLRGAPEVGQAVAVEEGVPLGGAGMGRGLWVHGVLHQDEEHVPHPAGFHRHQPLALGQLFAGLDGVVQGVAEQGADVQGSQEPPVGERGSPR